MNLVIRFFGINGNAADAGICTKASSYESDCSDGLDNNCDGLTDDEDPVCRTTYLPGFCNNNGRCDAGETAATCQDCPAVCGDNFCDRRCAITNLGAMRIVGCCEECKNVIHKVNTVPSPLCQSVSLGCAYTFLRSLYHEACQGRMVGCARRKLRSATGQLCSSLGSVGGTN